MTTNNTSTVVVLPIDNSAATEAEKLSTLGKIGVVITYTRIPIGVAIAVTGFMGIWLLAALLLALFALLDLLDGRFARAGGVSDTAKRRIFDACTDKVTAHLCFIVIATQIPSILWVWPIVLLRDLIQGGTAFLIMRDMRVVVAGAWWHRFFTLGEIIWLCCAFILRIDLIPFGLPVLLFGMATLQDYVAQCFALQRINNTQAHITK
jgi:phosphatidylglycerophosphate synthase